MVEIPAPDDPRLQVVIDVPCKGGKRVTLRVPRFDFIDETDHEAMTAELKTIETDQGLTERQRQRQSILTMLKRFVPAKDYKLADTLPVGSLNAVYNHWVEQSNISLGEFLASAPSSTGNTGAPSDTTSTPADGPAATSDAA